MYIDGNVKNIFWDEVFIFRLASGDDAFIYGLFCPVNQALFAPSKKHLKIVYRWKVETAILRCPLSSFLDDRLFTLNFSMVCKGFETIIKKH